MNELAISLDTVWMLLAAMLVFWMQPGFALCEAGFTRSKNTVNILMKNFVDFMLGSLLFFFVGFGFMFGSEGAGFIGAPNWGDLSFYKGELPVEGFLIFETVFCATAATIVSGAMAERTKFSMYLIYSAVISLFVYPIEGHWTWGGGWLSQLGFHDFAGSAIVHSVGGILALTGALALGPRRGKYGKDGKSRAIPGHNLALAALGVFILWLVNGILAGLVGITAGCDVVSPCGAVVIGLVCGTVLVYAIEFIDHKLHIDDPVGASSVHGVCGILGTVLTGVLATDGGLLYGGGWHFLGVQCLGIAVIDLWAAVCGVLLFFGIKKAHGLRVEARVEDEGLDIYEHGESCYN